MTNQIAAALNNFEQAYRSYAEVIGVAGDINVAVQYAVQDMFNQVKGLNAKTAVETIDDEVVWLVDTVAQRLGA